MDDADYANAVKHYRSQTLNAENRSVLKAQMLMKGQRAKALREVELAHDAKVSAQLTANEGLVMPHPAITFTPEHEVLRLKKEQ